MPQTFTQYTQEMEDDNYRACYDTRKDMGLPLVDIDELECCEEPCRKNCPFLANRK